MGPKFQSYGKDLPCDCWLRLWPMAYEADMNTPVGHRPQGLSQEGTAIRRGADYICKGLFAAQRAIDRRECHSGRCAPAEAPSLLIEGTLHDFGCCSNSGF
jgi:hypothetical protein